MEIHIGKRVADVSLVSKDGNKVRLTIDGIPYEVDVVMAENGACSILHNGVSYNAELIRGESGKNYTVNTHFLSYGVDIVDTQVNICVCAGIAKSGRTIRLFLRCPARW